MRRSGRRLGWCARSLVRARHGAREAASDGLGRRPALPGALRCSRLGAGVQTRPCRPQTSTPGRAVRGCPRVAVLLGDVRSRPKRLHAPRALLGAVGRARGFVGEGSDTRTANLPVAGAGRNCRGRSGQWRHPASRGAVRAVGPPSDIQGESRLCRGSAVADAIRALAGEGSGVRDTGLARSSARRLLRASRVRAAVPDAEARAGVPGAEARAAWRDSTRRCRGIPRVRKDFAGRSRLANKWPWTRTSRRAVGGA